MIKPIVTDKLELAQVSTKIPAGSTEANTITQDLLDTAKHYQLKPIGCVGLAANQINHLRRIIVYWNGGAWNVMINPTIEIRPGKFGLSHEACLSRPGVRTKIKRAKRIVTTYWDENEDLIEQKFSGMTARIIQHEVDHLDGRFI